MRHLGLGCAVATLLLLFGCSSGGGSSSAAPQPQATLGGAGPAALFNQKITFTIDVPALSTQATSARRRSPVRPVANAVAPVATPAATTPYVSPLTGSVVLTLAEVSGVSPQQAAPAIPPVNVPVSCQGSSAGCTIPVANVPAAIGIDRYFIQTYTGLNATGSLISTGFVDVTVPVKANSGPAIGPNGAAVSIGGYVATITLAPLSLNIVQGTPSDLNVLVQALDAGGATIVGAAQYATPVTVALNGDTQNFSLNGGLSVTVNGPLPKPLDLHYGGGSSYGTQVQATSQDENGNTVTATPIVVNVLAPGSTATSPPPVGIGLPSPTPTPVSGGTSPPVGGTTPTPVGGGSPTPTPTPSPIPTTIKTPVPTPKPTPTLAPTQALSLYVADAQSDTVSEYRIASQIASGAIPNPAATPSRVVSFNPLLAKSPTIGSGGLSCGPDASVPSGNGNGTAGVAVDPAAGTIFMFPACTDGVNAFVFGYPAGAVGTPVPTIYDPVPQGFGDPVGLAVSASTVYAGSYLANAAVYGFPLATTGKPPSLAIGSNSYPEFGNPSPGVFANAPAGFGLDSSGFLYIPAWWNDTAQGSASVLQNPSAVLAVSATGVAPDAVPHSAISGLNSNVGGSTSSVAAATVDGSTLYVLTGANTLSPANANDVSYYPGVSSCPPPSATAQINSPVPPSGLTTCADQNQHWYLAGYSLNSQLLGPTVTGTDVDLVPNFVIGGDTVGRFGCSVSGLINGQFLAASGGYVYVINQTPTCATDSSGSGIVAPEIDVYNTNGLSGAYTNIAPVFTLSLTAGFPSALTVAPSGTVVGGQALLRAPLSRPYRPNLYGRRIRRLPIAHYHRHPNRQTPS